MIKIEKLATGNVIYKNSNPAQGEYDTYFAMKTDILGVGLALGTIALSLNPLIMSTTDTYIEVSFRKKKWQLTFEVIQEVKDNGVLQPLPTSNQELFNLFITWLNT
jgi:hypothetical protein